jgi:hypothetical protein
MLLPDDVDIKTALDILAIFKERLSGFVTSDSVVDSTGRVLIKGDAIYKLLVEITKYEKQLKHRKQRNSDKVIIDRIKRQLENHNELDWHDEDEQRCQNMR